MNDEYTPFNLNIKFKFPSYMDYEQYKICIKDDFYKKLKSKTYLLITLDKANPDMPIVRYRDVRGKILELFEENNHLYASIIVYGKLIFDFVSETQCELKCMILKSHEPITYQLANVYLKD